MQTLFIITALTIIVLLSIIVYKKLKEISKLRIEKEELRVQLRQSDIDLHNQEESLSDTIVDNIIEELNNSSSNSIRIKKEGFNLYLYKIGGRNSNPIKIITLIRYKNI